VSTERYPIEDTNPDYDNGTMEHNVATLANCVIGRRIVSAVEGPVAAKNEWSGYIQTGLILTLDDGTQVRMADSSDCCAYTELTGFLLDPSSVDHIILGVGTTDDYTTWHIYADFGDIMRLKVGWSCGNPFYYGYGFDIDVVGVPNQAVSETYVTDDDADAAIERERAVFRAEDDRAEDEARTYLHGDAERELFRAKLQEMRATNSVPGYVGPRAAR